MMRNGLLTAGSAGVLALATSILACGNSGSSAGGAAGRASSDGGATSNGGASSSGGAPAGGASTCSNVTPCGGSVIGSWTVASSCLKLSGNMDVSLLGLGTAGDCLTVPAIGSITTSGTFVANPDGTFIDNTTTTGSATFPLAASCLSVSHVDITCERMASIFSAAGWTTSTCTDTAGQCSCSLSTNQQAGLGMVSVLATKQGTYSTSGNVLTVGDLNYQYCASGQTLSLTPQLSGLTGSVSLTKNDVIGAGGAPGVGGATNNGGAGAGGMLAMSGAGGSLGRAGAGGSVAMGGGAGAAGSPGALTLPCDIYAAANTTCVAAHSTIRALFGSFAGSLYQVKRASDSTTKDIPVLQKGGYADSVAQDTFCTGTTCTITKVYDQSGHGNFVEAETPDSSVMGHSGMTAANAAQEKLNVGGHQVYSLYTKPSQAYWRDGSKTGMPTGAAPQGIYIVTSGKHFSSGCCYDYGNGETSRTYVPGASMDALYFGNSTTWGSGNGSGPWVMADLEGGVFSGPSTAKNNNLLSHTSTYVTAIEKNNGTTEMQLKAADATTGTLTTYYKGALPPGKNPMQKQGSIVLGSGGDCCYSNNNASQGTFYEGAIVAGYPSDAADASVHANIVGAGYGK